MPIGNVISTLQSPTRSQRDATLRRATYCSYFLSNSESALWKVFEVLMCNPYVIFTNASILEFLAMQFYFATVARQQYIPLTVI